MTAPDDFQHHLQVEIASLLKAALSENTHKTYQTGFQAYYEFVQNEQYNIWPPTSDSLVQFVAYLSVKGLSNATVRSYLAGVYYYAKTQRSPRPNQSILSM